MNTKDSDKIIGAYEASEILRIPLSSLYYLSNTGKVRAIRVGRRWRYRKIDIEHYAVYGTAGLNKKQGTIRRERRQSPRINCHILCKYKVGLPNRNHSAESIIKNIGATGLFLDISNHFSAGIDDPVEMYFELGIPYEENKEIIKILGRVVMITDTGAGIKYRNLPPLLKDTITKYVGE